MATLAQVTIGLTTLAGPMFLVCHSHVLIVLPDGTCSWYVLCSDPQPGGLNCHGALGIKQLLSGIELLLLCKSEFNALIGVSEKILTPQPPPFPHEVWDSSPATPLICKLITQRMNLCIAMLCSGPLTSTGTVPRD